LLVLLVQRKDLDNGAVDPLCNAPEPNNLHLPRARGHLTLPNTLAARKIA
jgi:hypothetical protein